MRRYDVCILKNSKTNFVLILQHDATAHLATCIVAPLVSKFVREAEEKIRPTIHVNGKDLQIQTDRMAAIPRASIGLSVASADDQQDAIKNAIDRLFLGF
jgi:thiamine monophosphate synthase